MFRYEGTTWQFAFSGQHAQLPDAKGLHDIAALLRSPGREIHVFTLLGMPAPPNGADVVLDEHARAEYARGWRSSSARSPRLTPLATRAGRNARAPSETRSSTSSARLLDSAVASGDSAIKRSARGKQWARAYVTRWRALSASTRCWPATCA